MITAVIAVMRNFHKLSATIYQSGLQKCALNINDPLVSCNSLLNLQYFAPEMRALKYFIFFNILGIVPALRLRYVARFINTSKNK